MPNIDDLSIGIKSNVTSATNSIDKLITKLGALSASLGQVNTSGFSAMASGIRQIENATKGISGNSAKNITELSLAIRKFGSKTANQATSNIPSLANSIQALTTSVNGMIVNKDSVDGIISLSNALSKLGRGTATQATTNIPELQKQLVILVDTVNKLSESANGISYLSQLSSALTKLGAKTGKGAVDNIPELTKALMQMINTLSKAPQVSYNTIQLVNALANLASQGSKVGTASNSLYSGFMRFGKGAEHASKKSFSLASAIGKLYASYWLLLRAFRGIGSSITLASDLQEVQNVVDVTFGQYKSLIEDFASTSIQDYGMSELTAKQIAGRFQAMGSAMGFAQGRMAEMSIELTRLTGDMASFYNVEQADMAKSLQAIFTGETEPLRKYGIDITNATLESWLLAQGIDASVASMTQAEKVLLRYNYVMEATSAAQGDFARTSGNWANQIRVLKQQFEALSAIIGQNFIYALKPLVSALNTVMAKLIQFARVVSNSLGVIFGWKYEDTTGGLVSDLEMGSEYASDLGGGLGGAADNAKKLKRQLQGFDELNVLTTNQGTSGGGGGGASSTDIPTAEGGEWVKTPSLLDFESDLDTLYKLGDYIGTALTNQLRSIDWQKVYQGAKDFGSGLALFLNGLISPELFSATGSTIAGALNTAIYSTLAFGEEFDFEEFGLSIAEGINSFFRDTDFKALGQDIKTWVIGLKNTLITIIKEIEWGEILSGIGDVLGSLDAETIATLFSFGALSMLFKRGLFATLATGLSTITSLPASLTLGLNGLGASIRTAFIGGLGAAFLGFNLGEEIYKLITGDDISDIDYMYYLTGEGKVTKEDLSDAFFGEMLAGNNVAEFATRFSRNMKDISAVTKKYLTQASKSTNTFSKDYTESMNDVSDSTNESFATLYGVVEEYTNNISETGIESFTDLKEQSSRAFALLTSNVSTQATMISQDISNKFGIANNNIKSGSAQTTNDVINKFNSLGLNVTSVAKTMSDVMNSSSNSIKITSADTTSDIVAKYKAMRESNETEVNNLKTRAVALLSAIKTDGIRETDGLNTNLKAKFEDAKFGADSSFGSMHNLIVRNMQNSKKTIASENWYGAGTNLVAGLASGIADKWSSTSSSGLVGKIVSLASGLTGTLKRAFGIHSPSREWAIVGQYLTQGLEIGTLSEEGHLNKSIIAMGNRLTDSFSNSLTLATPKSLIGGSYDFGVASTMAHQYSADSSMSSNIADGVRQGVVSAQAEQNALLREQNQLLMQILDKTGINSGDLFNAVRKENRQHYNQTGVNAFVF